MKIKIEAYQKYGKTTEEPETFEFCCWQSLYEWLHKNKNLYACPKCKGLIKDANESLKKHYAEIEEIEKKAMGEVHL